MLKAGARNWAWALFQEQQVPGSHISSLIPILSIVTVVRSSSPALWQVFHFFFFFFFFNVDILGFCCSILFQDWVSLGRGLSFRLVLKSWQFSDPSIPVAGITSVSHYTQRHPGFLQLWLIIWKPWRSEVSQCSVVVDAVGQNLYPFLFWNPQLCLSHLHDNKSIFLIRTSLASSVLSSTSRAPQGPSLFYMQLPSSMSRVCSVKFHIGQLSQSRQPPRANLKCRPLSTCSGPFGMVSRPLLCYS